MLTPGPLTLPYHGLPVNEDVQLFMVSFVLLAHHARSSRRRRTYRRSFTATGVVVLLVAVALVWLWIQGAQPLVDISPDGSIMIANDGTSKTTVVRVVNQTDAPLYSVALKIAAATKTTTARDILVTVEPDADVQRLVLAGDARAPFDTLVWNCIDETGNQSVIVFFHTMLPDTPRRLALKSGATSGRSVVTTSLVMTHKEPSQPFTRHLPQNHVRMAGMAIPNPIVCKEALFRFEVMPRPDRGEPPDGVSNAELAKHVNSLIQRLRERGDQLEKELQRGDALPDATERAQDDFYPMVAAARNLYLEMAGRLPGETKATDWTRISADMIMSSGTLAGARPFHTLATRLERLAEKLTP